MFFYQFKKFIGNIKYLFKVKLKSSESSIYNKIDNNVLLLI